MLSATIGIDLYKFGLEVKPSLLNEDGFACAYPSDYLDALQYDLVARDGKGHLVFCMEPIFPLENAAVSEIRTREEAFAHVAKTLVGKIQFEDGREPTYDEILALVSDIDVSWTEPL